jgi:uncharacterized oxidoreductase
MPVIKADELEALTQRIFAARGVPESDAAWVATLLVRANLRGHDSHGVIRIPQYVASMQRGEANPRPQIRVVRETPAMAMLDGDLGFGQVVARRGIEIAIAKARAHTLAAVTLMRTKHIGRLADYAELAAEQGMIGMLWVNSPTALNVAPWGGAARRLGTNPHAVAIPGPGGTAMSHDFATSVVAEGKVRVKHNRKQPAPPGWFLDAEGRPATDTARFYGEPRGALLTAAQHKGYGLSLVVEILAGILSGTGAARPEQAPMHNGTFMLVIDTERFVPLASFHQQVGDLFAFMRSATPAAGANEILVPGEPEARAEAERRATGIFVEDETWGQIQACII